MGVLSWVLTGDSRVQRNGQLPIRPCAATDSPTALSSAPMNLSMFFHFHLSVYSELSWDMLLGGKWRHSHCGHLLVLTDILYQDT